MEYKDVKCDCSEECTATMEGETQAEVALTEGRGSIRHQALAVAVRVHGDSCDFGEILTAAAAYEAYLRTGAVPTEDEDE